MNLRLSALQVSKIVLSEHIIYIIVAQIYSLTCKCISIKITMSGGMHPRFKKRAGR